MSDLSLLRSMTDNMVATAAANVAVLRQLGQAVDEIFLSATPIIGAEASESWGVEMQQVELEALLPVVAQCFDGDVDFHVNSATGTIDSRSLSGLECDGARYALAVLLGCDFDEVDDDYFAGDANPDLWLSFTVKRATDLAFAGRDAR